MSDSSNRDQIICTSNSAQLRGYHEISFPSSSLDCPDLPFYSGLIKWYNPMAGLWRGEAEITKNSKTLLTPVTGDWVVWAKRS